MDLPGLDAYEEFRKSVTPDLYETENYINWEGIDHTIAEFSSAITRLENLLHSNDFGTELLAAALTHERNLYELLSILLAIPHGVGFDDGRELPDPDETAANVDSQSIAGLLIEIGLPNLLKRSSDVTSLTRVALTVRDSGRRRYRVASKVRDRLQSVVTQAIDEANAAGDATYTYSDKPTFKVPGARIDYLVLRNGRPTVAIASVFQTASGGRQQRDLEFEYPLVQRELAPRGLSLVLIADGRGIRQAQDRVLDALFTGVASVMTFKQAEDGRLATEIMKLSSSPLSLEESRSVQTIIASTLQTRGIVYASDVPLDSNSSRLALASFVNDNRNFALELQDEGRTLKWSRFQIVEQLSRLEFSLDTATPLDVFAELMGAVDVHKIESADTPAFSLAKIRLLSDDSVLPDELLVAATGLPITSDAVRSVATYALKYTQDSKISILLSATRPDRETQATLRTLQLSLTSNVLVIEFERLQQMARASVPTRILVKRLLLEQSDLAKISPYVLNTVTPQRMFFGREIEEAFLVSRLATNSVALIGGRKIGKTSLMRHVDTQLRSAGYSVYFADCQTVKNWRDFANFVARRWSVPLDPVFTPSSLFLLVDTLRTRAPGRLVVLLDEIDQLLDWDSKHSEGEVPEAFFKACRTISQDGIAQFVFSGERTISGRLWDAHSPHWNFCQPLMVRQLDLVSSHNLLINPLRDLQLIVEDEQDFSAKAWYHTNGHPQLIQSLGDRIVQLVNKKPPSKRTNVSVVDLEEVADNFGYAEQYLETYWGQATRLERIFTLILAQGISTFAEIREFMHDNLIETTEEDIRAGLRMLELYGITSPSEGGYTLSLNWFVAAANYYGGVGIMLDEYLKGENRA